MFNLVNMLFAIFIIFHFCEDIRDDWRTWRLHRLEDLNSEQLSAMGFIFYGESEREDLLFLFHERFIFKLRRRRWIFSRIYIVDLRYLEMEGTMDMNIRLIDESCKKHLYTAIKKSIKDGSYLADPMLKEQLYADIERRYKKYVKMRQRIYGGNQTWE
ncbi:hypothetical protein AALH75_00615 [[Clostridium] innocuum]|mgnify:FL=1|uniref:hypothetical protein n=2 Tax=Clostridium innocuum TaxID=1522 RepID=UPI00189C0C93|nr:hypothetical protein [[Clostridium] innocuum]